MYIKASDQFLTSFIIFISFLDFSVFFSACTRKRFLCVIVDYPTRPSGLDTKESPLRIAGTPQVISQEECKQTHGHMDTRRIFMCEGELLRPYLSELSA